MKNAILICARMLSYLIVSVFLVACGSGGGGGTNSQPEVNPFFQSESIGLSCVEASNVDDEVCSGSLPEDRGVMRVALDNGPVHDSVYNAGDISKSGFVYFDLEATNGAFIEARLYIYIDEGGAHGCEDRNISTMMSPFDINQRAHKNIGTAGTGFDICAVNGASWANVTIYNGSHLALDMSGNPALDEALYTTTVLWNFTD